MSQQTLEQSPQENLAPLLALYLEAQPELERLVGEILAGPEDEVAHALRARYVSKTGSASARMPAVAAAEAEAEVVEHVRRGEVGKIAPVATTGLYGEADSSPDGSSTSAGDAETAATERSERTAATGRLRIFVAPFAVPPDEQSDVTQRSESTSEYPAGAASNTSTAFECLAGDLLAEHLMRLPALDVRLGSPEHRQATDRQALLDEARATEAAIAVEGRVRREETGAQEASLVVEWTLHLVEALDEGVAAGEKDNAATEQEPQAPQSLGTESWTYTLAELESWNHDRTLEGTAVHAEAHTAASPAGLSGARGAAGGGRLHPAVQMALPALRVIRRLGVPCEPADLERLALPVSLEPQAMQHWVRARQAEQAGELRAAWQYYTLALELEPGLRAVQAGLRRLVGLLPELDSSELSEEVQAALDAYPTSLAAFAPYRAVARHADPSLSPWMTDMPQAERDDFSALAFSEQPLMGHGLDGFLERLLALHAYGTVARLATALLESHVGREDTPLPVTFAQWQMSLTHPGNRTVLDREQRRAFLHLCLLRAELGLGRWEDAVERAEYISLRFPHVAEIKHYAETFIKELSQYDAQAFRQHQFESQEHYAEVRPHLERAYVEGGYIRVPRLGPASRVRAWAAQRAEVSWESYGNRWEAVNRLARQRVPRPFPFEPDAAELERLESAAAELEAAATPTGRRLAYRPLSLLGERAQERLREHWQAAPAEPGSYGLLLSGLVRAGEPPSEQAFAELVGSDPLTAARVVRALTPAVVPRSARGEEFEELLDLPERRAAKVQRERIPASWRPLLWLCLEALPLTARSEAEHVVALLSAAAQPEEEERFLAAYPRAPEACAAALLALGSSSFPQGGAAPRELAGFCLYWRSAFRAGGVAALAELAPEEPEWMMALGRAVADMLPTNLLAPTRLANEVAKHRSERGLAERDMLHFEELAAGALGADTRPQTAKVAVLILEQILKRWPPFDLSPGDHIWMFGTIERLARAEEEKARTICLELATRSAKLLQQQESLDFGERELRRERYYTSEQTLLVELLRRLIVTLDRHRCGEVHELFAGMIRTLPLPAQGNLIPLLEAALAGYGAEMLPVLKSWLERPDPFVVGTAHRLLDRVELATVNTSLAAWLADEHPVVRHAAFETLRRRGGTAAAFARSLLRNDEPRLQAAALELLARLPAETAKLEDKQLAQVLATTSSRPVLRAACRVAAVHRLKAAFPALASRLASWPFDDRLELLEAAARTGGLQAAPFLIRALKSRSTEEREFAHRHLLRITGELRGPEVSAWTSWWMQVSATITLPPVFRTHSEAAGGADYETRAERTRARVTPLPEPYRSRVREAAASLDVPRDAGPVATSEKASAAAADPPPTMPEITELPDEIELDEEALELGSGETDILGYVTAPAGGPAASTTPPPATSPPDSSEEGGAELAEVDELDELAELEEILDASAGEANESDLEAPDAPDAQGDAQAEGSSAQGTSSPGGESLDPELAQLAGLTDAELADLVSLGNREDFTQAPGGLGEISKSLPQMPVLELGEASAKSQPTSLDPLAPAASPTAVGGEELVEAVPADPVFDAFAGMDFDASFEGVDEAFAEPISEEVPLAEADDLPADTDGTTILQAPTDQVLIATPLNEVSGGFALGSLHGNGLGRWVDTNPDRFAADNSSWFLAGDPSQTHYQFVVPFYLLAGSFEVVMAPDPYAPLARLYMDANEYTPGAWWTLMVERHGDSVKMRIAERDEAWIAVPVSGRAGATPLAAVGLHFLPGADVAFGDLALEPQEPREAAPRPRRAPPRRR